MAVNLVSIRGDSTQLTTRAINLTGPDPIEFISGSFRGGPEERRVCSIFFDINTKTFELRFEFQHSAFAETTITGVPIYVNTETQAPIETETS